MIDKNSRQTEAMNKIATWRKIEEKQRENRQQLTSTTKKGLSLGFVLFLLGLLIGLVFFITGVIDLVYQGTYPVRLISHPLVFAGMGLVICTLFVFGLRELLIFLMIITRQIADKGGLFITGLRCLHLFILLIIGSLYFNLFIAGLGILHLAGLTVLILESVIWIVDWIIQRKFPSILPLGKYGISSWPFH